MRLLNKAQGLPINTIILIAIGLLILVLFITFVLGGFKGIGGATNPNQQALQAFYGTCSSTCATDASANTYPSNWCSSSTIVGGATYYCYNQTGGIYNAPVTCNYNGSSVGVPYSMTPGTAGDATHCPAP
jgi:hypothetical protein